MSSMKFRASGRFRRWQNVMKMRAPGLPIGGKAALALLAIGASTISAQASAADVLFTVTGPLAATFTLPQSPTPADTNASVAFFQLLNFPANIEGNSTTALITEYSHGGFSLAWDSHILDVAGPTEFTGSVLTPTFAPGTYISPASYLTDLNVAVPSTYPIGQETITITAVPEPATWAMMLLGFGAIGFAMRGRCKRVLVKLA